MIECIHGLDIELCDICTPRQTPEAQDPAPVATRPAKAGAVRAAPTRTAAPRRAPARVAGTRRAPAADALPDIELAGLRGHHWTHIDNLEGILSGGRLRAGIDPEVDVRSADHREKIAATTLPSGATVDSFVPFAVSPDATTWDEVRRGADGERWSAAAKATKPTDYVILVAPVSKLGGDLVVADGEATAPLTRFAAGLNEGAALVRRAAIVDPDLLEVEILVPAEVDLHAVTLIGVPNDRMRDRVRTLVQAAGGAAPRVAIYPPWFRPSEA